MTQKSSHEFSVGRWEKMFVRAVLQFDSRAVRPGLVDSSKELGKYFASGASRKVFGSTLADSGCTITVDSALIPFSTGVNAVEKWA
jgi:hypothetical protein